MVLQLHQEVAHSFLLQSPRVRPNGLGIWFCWNEKVLWEVILNEGCGQEQRVGDGSVEWDLWPLYSLWVRRIFGQLRDPFRKHLCMVQLPISQASPYPHCSFPFRCGCYVRIRKIFTLLCPTLILIIAWKILKDKK